MPWDVNGLEDGATPFLLSVRWVEPIFGQELLSNPFVNTPARADGLFTQDEKGNQTR